MSKFRHLVRLARQALNPFSRPIRKALHHDEWQSMVTDFASQPSTEGLGILADRLEDENHPFAPTLRYPQKRWQHYGNFLQSHGLRTLPHEDEAEDWDDLAGHHLLNVKRGEAHPDLVEFLRSMVKKPSVKPLTKRRPLRKAANPVTGEVVVPSELSSKGSAYWLPTNAKLPHEKAAVAKVKPGELDQLNNGQGLMPMSTVVQATVAGRHGRHWYDENQDILRAATSHQADPFDFHRLAGLEAATSPNNAIEPNQQAAYDLYRIWHNGSKVNGEAIPARTTNKHLIRKMVIAYGSASGLHYPDNYPIKELAGQPMVSRKAQSSQNGDPGVRKYFHTDEGWVEAPIFYLRQAGGNDSPQLALSVEALAHPQRFTDPHRYKVGRREKESILGTAEAEKADSFLRNKLGNHEAVTIDRHEARNWGVEKLTSKMYHVLVAASRHVAKMLNSDYFNPKAAHPVYGRGWTPARGQAARWMTARAIRARVATGENAAAVATNLTAKEVYDNSAFVKLFESPALRARARTMIREGSLPPDFFNEVRRVDDRYRPPAHELEENVGHAQLIPLAKHIRSKVYRPGKGRGPTLPGME